jgi:hypothetical protein
VPERVARGVGTVAMVLIGACVAWSIGNGPPISVVSVHAAEQRVVGQAGSSDAGGRPWNPHSDLIFRATGAKSCGDCHRTGRDGILSPQAMHNDLVRQLRAKAKGIHGPGRFADCLRCHAGGRLGLERYARDLAPRP